MPLDGSHFHDWVDYNVVAVSIELPERDRSFLGFGGHKVQVGTDLACKTVVFFKSVTKSVKCGVRVLRAKRASLTVGRVRRLSSVSLSVFSLVPDLLFDCSHVLEYAKIMTVL